MLFERHTELLEFLGLVLPLQRSLVTADLLAYLADAQVDVEEARRVLMPLTKGTARRKARVVELTA